MVTPMAFKYNSFLFENYHVVITKNTGGQVLFPMSPLLFSYNVTAGKSCSYFRLFFLAEFDGFQRQVLYHEQGLHVFQICDQQDDFKSKFILKKKAR